MNITWLDLVRWIWQHGQKRPEFRHFAAERATSLGEPVPPNIPYWKQRLAPLSELKNGLTSAPTQFLVRENPPLVYVRIPKTASTAVLSILLPQLTQQDQPLTDDALEAQAYTLFQSKLSGAQRRYPKIAVVRHPVDRLLSVYKSYFGPENLPFLYSHHLWGIFRPDMSLEQVVTTLEHIPDRFRDAHFMSQTRLLGGKENSKKTLKYRLEELKPNQIIPELGAALPYRNVGTSREEPISSALRKRIERLYAEDMAELGYN